jgi:acyl-homoserine lactone synthase
MFKVHAIHVGNRHLYEAALDQHHRIRHDIYVGERKWMDLERADGREIDQFDTDRTVYLLGIEPGKGVVGGSRLVPTLEPHLMSDVCS